METSLPRLGRTRERILNVFVLGYNPVELSSTCIPSALVSHVLFVVLLNIIWCIYKIVFEVLKAVPMKMTDYTESCLRRQSLSVHNVTFLSCFQQSTQYRIFKHVKIVPPVFACRYCSQKCYSSAQLLMFAIVVDPTGIPIPIPLCV
jgi:hypothetical protein